MDTWGVCINSETVQPQRGESYKTLTEGTNKMQKHDLTKIINNNENYRLARDLFDFGPSKISVKTKTITTTKITTTVQTKTETEIIFEKNGFLKEIEEILGRNNNSGDLIDILKEDLKQQGEKLAVECDEFDQEGAWEKSIEWWKKHWEHVKWCDKNNKLMFLISYVQSRKTIVYLTFCYLAMKGFTKEDGSEEPAITDSIWLSTNNMLASLELNIKRAKKLLERYGITVFNTDKPHRFQKNHLCIGIHNNSRMEKLKSSLKHTQDEIKRIAKGEGTLETKHRVMVILDEGDELYGEMGDSSAIDSNDSTKAEKTLFDIQQQYDSVRVMSVSATTTSLLSIYGLFDPRLGNLDSRQIFQPELSKFYKGVATPIPKNGVYEYNKDFIKDGLKDENPALFRSGKYLRGATIHNTENPKFIAREMIKHHMDASTNPQELTQIATVTLGRSKDGHNRTAELLADSFKYYNPTDIVDVNEIQKQLSNTINPDANWVIVVHNGNTNKLNPEEKLKSIYDAVYEKHGSTKSLKGIIFVGGFLLGRAVTYEISDGWYEEGNKYFGAYCNLTFTYISQVTTAEAIIQSLRLCGVRPAYKEHVGYTTTSLKNDIEEYYNLTHQFLDLLKNNGQLDEQHVLRYGLNCKLTKDRLNKYANISKECANRSSSIKGGISKADRDTFIRNGFNISGISYDVKPKDGFVTISKQEYDEVDTYDPNYILNLLRKSPDNAWMTDQPKHRKLDSKFKTSVDHASQYTQFTDHAQTVAWEGSNGKYYLYYFTPVKLVSTQISIKFDLQFDVPGSIILEKQESIIERPASGSGGGIGDVITVGPC